MKINLSPFHRGKYSILFYVFIAILAIGTGIVFRQTLVAKDVKGQASVPPVLQSLPEPKISVSPLAGSTVLPQAPSNQPLENTQIVNGIEMTVSNFAQNKDRLSLDSCYTLPDDSAWIAYFPTVEYNGHVIQFSESIPLKLRLKKSAEELQIISFDSSGGKHVKNEKANLNDKGRRCDRFIFIVDSDTKGPFIFNFGSIVAEPREGEICALANIEIFQKALDKQNSQVKIGCNSAESTTSGGAEGIIIKEKPQTMSQEEALSLLGKPEIFIEAYGVSGPWVFHWDTTQK